MSSGQGWVGWVGKSGAWRIVTGVIAALAGVALLVVALLPEPPPSPPDPAAVARATRETNARIFGELWHSSPVEKLFPDRIRLDAGTPPSMFTHAGTPPSVFTRVGVAPEARCAEVLDPALVTALRVKCERVLRATYVDTTRAVVATAGIVVLDKPPLSEPDVRGARSGDVLLLRAFTVRDTDATRFGDKQRIHSSSATLIGEPQAPFLLTVVVGAADGRTRVKLPKRFDSEARRGADRGEWRVFGNAFLGGWKNDIYETIRAVKVQEPAP